MSARANSVDAVFTNATYPFVSDFGHAKPPSFDIPAMICQAEKNFYYWLASNRVQGTGAVVECGTWLGASTAYLAAGLKGRTIHCYDWYRWTCLNDWKAGFHLEDGSDFSSIFLANMEKCGAKVSVHQGMLEEFTWDGGPIELLVVDMGKHAKEQASLLTTFGPSFIPGVTHVSVQDYQYFPGYQISVVLDAVRASLSLENVVISSERGQPNTVSFLVTAPVDLEAANNVARNLTTWTVERIMATWERINRPLPEQARARLAPGLALFLYDAGHHDKAFYVLDTTPMDRAMERRWKRVSTYPDFAEQYAGLLAWNG